MGYVTAAEAELSRFADPCIHTWHILPWAVSLFPTSSIGLTFKCHLQRIRPWGVEALHSKVGTGSLVKHIPASKLSQDRISCVLCVLPPLANSLPAAAISAPSQSCIACAFDILQRVRCCCRPRGVTAVPRSTGSSQLRRGHLPHLGFLLLALPNIAIVSGNHTVGGVFSGQGWGKESCSSMQRPGMWPGRWDNTHCGMKLPMLFLAWSIQGQPEEFLHGLCCEQADLALLQSRTP